jgi:hypothetical protein
MIYLQCEHGEKTGTNGDSSTLEGAGGVAVVGWGWLDWGAISFHQYTIDTFCETYDRLTQFQLLQL